MPLYCHAWKPIESRKQKQWTARSLISESTICKGREPTTLSPSPHASPFAIQLRSPLQMLRTKLAQDTTGFVSSTYNYAAKILKSLAGDTDRGNAQHRTREFCEHIHLIQVCIVYPGIWFPGFDSFGTVE